MKDNIAKRCILSIQYNKLDDSFFAFSITDVKSDIYKDWKTEITLSGNIITERLVDDFENPFWNPAEGTVFIGLKKQMLSVKLMQRYDQHTEDECFLIPVQDFSYITSILKIQWGMYLVRVCFYNNQGVVIHAREINTSISKDNIQARDMLHKFFFEINPALSKWKTLLGEGAYCNEGQIYIV
ncbi:hypothetical protein LW858_31910 (plasmid) [Bacillus cereus]|uniref:Uncharacterized protein n=1 Tax=Bacillus cereus TaxID=1396 RepID=A0A9X6B3Q1_BACCE|nr:hypothetical protein [Bacillus cereus]OOR71631.1 hypothetical protein BLX06_29410 [Bacillus cereus]UIJ69939.1 hypothetical protein LW858_31910 [Bacillus cereus]